MSVSVLILTLNEEVNLERCLASLKWSDDIVVLDSFSTDRTVEIATTAGARVVQRTFDNWSAHQNWAVENISFKHPWVYYSDADEVVPPELAQEMLAIANEPKRKEVAFRLRFQNMFMGQWIRRSSLYPTWVLRFFRPENVRWERLVNPTPVVDGEEGRLENHFVHYSFNKGLTAWFMKHNRYSTTEAAEGVQAVLDHGAPWKSVFSKTPAVRRKALKDISFRVPWRAALVYVYLMFVKRGVLDGRTGWMFCRMRSYYEFMIAAKMREHRILAAKAKR